MEGENKLNKSQVMDMKFSQYMGLIEEGIMCLWFCVKVSDSEYGLIPVNGSFEFLGIHSFIGCDGRFKEMIEDSVFAIIEDKISEGSIVSIGEYDCSLCFNLCKDSIEIDDYLFTFERDVSLVDDIDCCKMLPF